MSIPPKTRLRGHGLPAPLLAAALVALVALAAGCGGGSDGKKGKGGGGRADHLVVNEVYTGEPDFLEIWNPVPTDPDDPQASEVSLNAWSLEIYDDGQLVTSYGFPIGVTLGGGAVLSVREGDGTDVFPRTLYLGVDLPWASGFPLEVLLRDFNGAVVDYVAVNTSGEAPNLNPPNEFSGRLDQGSGEDVVFRDGLADTDHARDFLTSDGRGTEGVPNPGQGGGVFIVNDSLPVAYAGQGVLIPYQLDLVVEGGTPPYSWSLISGTLPPTFSLDPQTGRLSGTPPTSFSSTFTVKATDSFDPPRSGFAFYTLDSVSVPLLSSPKVLINEVSTEAEAYVELYNPVGSGGAADVSGWTVRFAEDPAFVEDLVIRPGTVIEEGKVVLVREGFEATAAITQYTGFLVPWNTPERGACVLLDESGGGIDYISWNDPFAPRQPTDVNWFGSIVAPNPGQILYRNSGVDTDTPADWTVPAAGGGTPGTRNPGQ